MSYARKAKGFRSIRVAGVEYRWCVRTGRDYARVILQGGESGGQQAVVTMRGLRDPWLAFPDSQTKFFTVSPKMVPSIIHRALALGWQPARRMAPLRFEFEVEG